MIPSSSRRWQYIENENCPECGDAVEVFTYARQGSCHDDDDARCANESCETNGRCHVDEDGEIFLTWHDY